MNVKNNKHMCIYITKPLCCTPEANTTLLINYTPLQKSKKKKDDSWSRKANMRRVGWTRAIWVFNCNFLQRQSCTAVPQIWCVESSFPPWRLPVKDFVIACGQAWKITHRFLTRSWTPLVLTVISKESTCMHTYTNTCTHWLSFSH